MTTHEKTFNPRLALIIFASLVTLTILTVLLSGINVSDGTAVIIAMLVASLKAALVLIFFMHLNHEPLIFKIFLGVAFFTLLVLFVLTFSDYVYRGIA